MKYSETGNFTKEQRAICRRISELIRTARKKGLVIKITNDKLRAYLTDEANVAATQYIDKQHPIKSLSCGQIDVNTKDVFTLFWQQDDFDE
jgi:phage I-like protein